jgi:hypothetical protein
VDCGTGGEGGIRTPDTLSGMPVFKTGAINHSATSPDAAGLVYTPPFCPANRANQVTRLVSQAEGAGMKFHDLGEVGHKIGEGVVAGVQMVLMLHAQLL